jgi:APA family basic amino acid/polyamine antiporter
MILLTWAVGAGFALAGALVYSQLAIWHPESGGEYVYLTKAYGRSWGFVSGWVSFFAGFSAPIAAAALAFSDYLAYFFPALSSSKAAITLGSGSLAFHIGPAQLVACALIAVFTALNMLRVEVVARVQNSLTLIKVIAIAAFVVLGIAIGKGDWSHFSLPAVRTSTAPLGSQFLVSLLWVMAGYSGWNAATYVAGEIEDPDRTLPRSLALGTAVVAILYLGLNLTFIYATPLESMKGVLRVGALSASSLFGSRVAGVFSGLMALAIMSTVNAMVTAGPRVYYAMARNGAFPAFAGRVSKTSHTPAKAVIAQSICAMAMTVTSFPQLVVFIGFTLTIFTTLAVASIFVLGQGRRTMWAPAIAYCVLGLGTVVYGFIWQPAASTAALAVIVSGALVYSFGFARGNRMGIWAPEVDGGGQ